MSNYIRNRIDALLAATEALPAAGSTSKSAAIDLGSTSPWPATEGLQVVVEIPALSGFVAEKDLTVNLEHSATPEDADFTSFATKTLTAGTGGGLEAQELRFTFPPEPRRYLRATYAVETGGGTVTTSSATVGIRL